MTRQHVRPTLYFSLTLLVFINSIPTVMAAGDIASEVTANPAGAQMEIRLKSKQTLRGTRGDVSTSSFARVDAQALTRQISFDDVAAVKQTVVKQQLPDRRMSGVMYLSLWA